MDEGYRKELRKAMNVWSAARRREERRKRQEEEEKREGEDYFDIKPRNQTRILKEETEEEIRGEISFDSKPQKPRKFSEDKGDAQREEQETVLEAMEYEQVIDEQEEGQKVEEKKRKGKEREVIQDEEEEEEEENDIFYDALEKEEEEEGGNNNSAWVDVEEDISWLPSQDLELDPTEKEPLYEGCPISSLESKLMLLQLFIRFNCSQKLMDAICRLASAHCVDSERCCGTFQELKQYFSVDEDCVIRHHFCSKCHHRFLPEEEFCSTCLMEKSGTEFFVEFPFERELQRRFEGLFQFFSVGGKER